MVQVKNKDNQVIAEKKLRFQRLNLLNDLNTENLKDVNLAGQFTDRLSLDSLDEFISDIVSRIFAFSETLQLI